MALHHHHHAEHDKLEEVDRLVLFHDDSSIHHTDDHHAPEIAFAAEYCPDSDCPYMPLELSRRVLPHPDV